MPEYALRALAISRAYGDRLALDELTLDVPLGGVFGLLGPNGSGKSTFVAMLAAMEQPERGQLEVFGEPPFPRLKARLATVFQENTADPLMTAKEYLRFAGRLFGVQGSVLDARVTQLLGRFGLGERAGDAVGSFSGGMRRRLEVARALLHRPELLLLDEPTTGIDADERRVLWDILLAERQGTTVLLATNDLAEADTICDRVAFLKAGRVVASGTPAELKAGLRRESVRVTWLERSDEAIARLAALPGTGELADDGDVTVVTTDDASGFVPQLFEIAPGAVRAVSIARASLEDAYFQHVGRRTEGAAR